jgi:hypothetical protein
MSKATTADGTGGPNLATVNPVNVLQDFSEGP